MATASSCKSSIDNEFLHQVYLCTRGSVEHSCRWCYACGCCLLARVVHREEGRGYRRECHSFQGTTPACQEGSTSPNWVWR
ncbi:hypothetical protein L873DRAFT_1383166 [Choiromyces venosus 120613-1]|uniref:Uncharacterized protein n=1 Tax=Choiromyces venosus 120613-1 TaxID=1336337 RepID=A0A3N4JM70_9PEZI|nr:hypothetical protein L873DRAFT_1383166 [Choiromyces venosus 120613-1]